MVDIQYLDQYDSSILPEMLKTFHQDRQKTFSKTKQSTLYTHLIKQKILLNNQSDLGNSDNQTLNIRPKQDTHRRRLQQNRESAKKSRLKKKQYLNFLQQKSKSLEDELLQVTCQLTQAKKNLQKYIQTNTIDGFNIGRKQTYDRLSHLIQDQNLYDQDEINLLLDTLKHRVGATGKERQSTLNYYFKKMIDVCIPSLNRYLMWTASQEIQFFNQNQTKSQLKWTKQLFDNLKISSQQKQQLLNLQKRLKSKKQKIDKSINNFKEQKINLQYESGRIQNTIQQMRKCLSPIQSAKFILFIQNYKYKKQMNLWIQNKNPNFQEESKIKKKIKLQ